MLLKDKILIKFLKKSTLMTLFNCQDKLVQQVVFLQLYMTLLIALFLSFSTTHKIFRTKISTSPSTSLIPITLPSLR